MRIQTGNGTIPLMTLIAIWSISLVVNLPGLAISPILERLNRIFPDASQLEVQLLTVLPNLFIIPFILLSGRLSVARNKLTMIVVGLILYLISGILYFFASSMTELIVISCLLGVGCGILIPLAAGLIADVFSGKQRMAQLGIKSGIANASLVVATLLVGVLAKINWHLPFVVYLLPFVPLLLSPFLIPINRSGKTVPKERPASSTAGVPPSRKNALWALMGIYGFMTYSVVVISYYLPYIAAKYDLSSTDLGVITSMFFVAIVIPGFFLRSVVRLFGHRTMLVAAVVVAMGIGAIAIASQTWQYAIAAFFAGAGYGIIQPIVYDKTAIIAPSSHATLYMSFVLATNYVAVTTTPFVIEAFRFVFHQKTEAFPFVLNFVLLLGFVLVVVLFSKKFVFKMNNDYVG